MNPDLPHGSYKKDLTSDKVTNILSMFVKIFDFLRCRSAVQLGLMVVIHENRNPDGLVKSRKQQNSYE